MIFVKAEDSGKTVEHVVSTLDDARKVKNIKIDSGSTNVKIFIQNDEGGYHHVTEVE